MPNSPSSKAGVVKTVVPFLRGLKAARVGKHPAASKEEQPSRLDRWSADCLELPKRKVQQHLPAQRAEAGSTRERFSAETTRLESLLATDSKNTLAQPIHRAGRVLGPNDKVRRSLDTLLLPTQTLNFYRPKSRESFVYLLSGGIQSQGQLCSHNQP